MNASAPKLKKEPMTKKDINVAAKKKSPGSFALPLPPAPTRRSSACARMMACMSSSRSSCCLRRGISVKS